MDKIAEIREPIDTVTIFVPNDYVGAVMKLCQEKRGVQVNLAYHGRQVHLTYELPLAEIVLDFFDRMKSITRGYASMDYEFKEYRASDVVKVDMLINGDRVDALSSIIHRTAAQSRGREIVTRLRSLIPRQMYDVAIQAAIGANIIARENVKALRKNVLAKCYGGDITRKKKLLEKQKAGKKRMKRSWRSCRSTTRSNKPRTGPGEKRGPGASEQFTEPATFACGSRQRTVRPHPTAARQIP